MAQDTDTGNVTRVILQDDYYGYRFPVPSRFTPDFLASDADKWALLASIGITRRSEDDTPLRAWRDAVAEASELPGDYFRLEDGGHPLDLGFSPHHVRMLVWHLA